MVVICTYWNKKLLFTAHQMSIREIETVIIWPVVLANGVIYMSSMAGWLGVDVPDFFPLSTLPAREPDLFFLRDFL